MKLVIDNSVAMRCYLQTAQWQIDNMPTRVAALVENSEVHVPALFVTEAANIISRALKVGLISPQECESRFDQKTGLPTRNA